MSDFYGHSFHLLSLLLRLVWYAAQGYVLLFCGYVFAPTLLYLVLARRVNKLFDPREPAAAQTDFILLIPAHNEEVLLPALLASIGRLRYPAARFRTVVIADNCTDCTAQLARQAGAECLERRTAYPSDKSQALHYATAQLGLGTVPPPTVVCVLDADCQLDPLFLAELDREFSRPGAAPVLQASRRVGNAFESDVTVLDAAAEAMRQQVMSGTRYLLGLEAFICGLGCCMRAHLFARVMALPVTSLAEDKEWKAYFTRHRIAVRYCPAASLSYQAVGDGAAFRQQRRRWISGHLASARTHGLPTLGLALRHGSLAQLDFAFDLLQPPRSVLLVATGLFGLVSWAAGSWSVVGPGIWLALAGALLSYGAVGLRLIGAAPRHFWALLSGVRLVAGVVKSAALTLAGQKEKSWKATR